MTMEDLGKMADDYARELAPDNKNAQTAISADSFGFLDKVMEKCCLVDKGEIKEMWEEITNVYLAKDHITYDGARYIFKELFGENIFEELYENKAKDVEDEKV